MDLGKTLSKGNKLNRRKKEKKKNELLQSYTACLDGQSVDIFSFTILISICIANGYWHCWVGSAHSRRFVTSIIVSSIYLHHIVTVCIRSGWLLNIAFVM